MRMRHENLFIPVTLIISIAYSFSMFLASLALTRRLGFQKSCYMILESGYYLHHKSPAILYSFDYYKDKSMVNYCIIVP